MAGEAERAGLRTGTDGVSACLPGQEDTGSRRHRLGCVAAPDLHRLGLSAVRSGTIGSVRGRGFLVRKRDLLSDRMRSG